MPCGHASRVEGCPECESSAPTLVRAQEPSTRQMPTAGTRVGRYVVEERIGQGGMGMVFAARDPRLDRRVAIKLLLSPDETEAGPSQLLGEAQAMAKLSHPNVLPVFDVGPFDLLRRSPQFHPAWLAQAGWLVEGTTGWRTTMVAVAHELACGDGYRAALAPAAAGAASAAAAWAQRELESLATNADH